MKKTLSALLLLLAACAPPFGLEDARILVSVPEPKDAQGCNCEGYVPMLDAETGDPAAFFPGCPAAEAFECRTLLTRQHGDD